MNILQLSLLLAILLKCVTASENGVKEDVIKALGESEKGKGFESIKRDWIKWEKRNDLFDEVVRKGVEFIVGFIKQNGWEAKKATLAALFFKNPDMVDKVLEKINYDDYDLWNLTKYRPELAESHEGFFKSIYRIKGIQMQEQAVSQGVSNLFDAEKYASVIHLINALESSTLNRDVKNAVILKAFYGGAKRGIIDIVEKLHEHSAIASDIYAYRLVGSWNKGEPNPVFLFLLEQADQGDLREVKSRDEYKNNPNFSKAVDKADAALSKAPSKVPRHARPAERERVAKLAIITLANLMPTGGWLQVPGVIIASSAIGEQEGPKLVKSVKQQIAAARSSTEVPPTPQASSQSNLSPKTNIEQEGRKGEKVDTYRN